MSPQVERRAIPTLMGGQRRQIQPGYGQVHTLLDLLQEGFYLLFMLRNGSAPPGEAAFTDSITAYLAEFDREARKLRAQGEDIDAAKYAFCAALDEIILASPFPMRLAWERRPLQLVIFGDQLAGEHFFDRLEALRSTGGARLAALQVFHMCLLIGFRGKFAIDAGDKLAYLTAHQATIMNTRPMPLPGACWLMTWRLPGHRRGASPPDRQRPAVRLQHPRRNRHRPRPAPLCGADRLRRLGGVSVPRVRSARRPDPYR